MNKIIAIVTLLGIASLSHSVKTMYFNDIKAIIHNLSPISQVSLVPQKIIKSNQNRTRKSLISRLFQPATKSFLPAKNFLKEQATKDYFSKRNQLEHEMQQEDLNIIEQWKTENTRKRQSKKKKRNAILAEDKRKRKQQEEPVITQSELEKLFPDTSDPRALLNLSMIYTPQEIATSIEKKKQKIKSKFKKESWIRAQMLFLIETAGDYAQFCFNNKFQLTPKDNLKWKTTVLEFHNKIFPERIQKGLNTLAMIQRGRFEYNLGETPQYYLTKISNLIWYFYHCAIEKGQPFEEGTFVIEDPNNKIYTFLMNYVKAVNPTVTKTKKDPAAKTSGGYIAYPRASTHFKFKQKQGFYPHYGIDARFQGYKNEVVQKNIFPAKKNHLLFGKIADNLIFIKPENAGLGVDEVPQHAWELGWAFARKSVHKTGLHKILPHAVINYIGTDDSPLFCKERVPNNFYNAVKQTIVKTDLPLQEKEKQIQQIKNYGIQYLPSLIRTFTDNKAVQPEEVNTLKTINSWLNNKYDNNHLRHGREVILTQKYLNQQLDYAQQVTRNNTTL